jgi:hypothetical protein
MTVGRVAEKARHAESLAGQTAHHFVAAGERGPVTYLGDVREGGCLSMRLTLSSNRARW